MKEYYRVQANINLDAIYDNAIAAKKIIKPDTKLMAIVKADAYGHGATEVAKAIDDIADAYGVAILEEGIELRQAGITKPILILGYTPAPLYEAMINYNICTTIFKYDMAKEISEAAVKLGTKAKVHIKLDTGMNRIGFKPDDESLNIIKKIAKLSGISIIGCFTHFARMDEADKTKSKEQLKRYIDFTKRIEALDIKIPIKHVSNSAAIIEMSEANFDMVRDGISLYGMYPSEEVNKKRISLTPAMEIISYIAYIKTIAAGVEVGYGGTYTTKRTTKVATIPVGYADGYPRSLSNKGCILVNGQRAPIIGKICMDQFMVDITDIKNVHENDKVTLIGHNDTGYISIEEMANLSGSFNYEFVCDIGKRVPKVYYRHGKKIGTKDYYPQF